MIALSTLEQSQHIFSLSHFSSLFFSCERKLRRREEIIIFY
jgi:hypothetical protein